MISRLIIYTRKGRIPRRGRGAEHSRVRGDDWAAVAFEGWVSGTPPRARGRRVESGPQGTADGNTPACAGTTWTRPWRCTTSREHPRVRGDDKVLNPAQQDELGTPPRARGRLAVGGHQPHLSRNTPACAGTTSAWARGAGGCPEHPRVRGDDDSDHDVSRSPIGTPPRARGRLVLQR